MQFLTEEHGDHKGDHDADSDLTESEVQGVPDCLKEDLIGEETNVVLETNPLWRSYLVKENTAASARGRRVKRKTATPPGAISDRPARRRWRSSADELRAVFN